MHLPMDLTLLLFEIAISRSFLIVDEENDKRKVDILQSSCPPFKNASTDRDRLRLFFIDTIASVEEQTTVSALLSRGCWQICLWIVHDCVRFQGEPLSV